GSVNSRHAVKSLHLYHQSFIKGFEGFYGDISDYCILALLPSYLERQNSSLVYMVKEWMERSGHPSNAFYLHDQQSLAGALKVLENKAQKTILIGVTYALLDFAERYPMSLSSTIIMETGGMKGRREELLRAEVHKRLKGSFGLTGIHSEYGMTELLSQAYALDEGRFRTPPWMKILMREEGDPGQLLGSTPRPASGGLNVIDLANLHACSFIATEDVCRLLPDGSFEVLGRLDNTDIRGCSLLAL
ncbi:MAG TPA: acyl transferase, partial [Flavisolibacter sp.]